MVPSPSRLVIVADDDADDIFFARRSLEKAGLGPDVRTCSDGRELLGLLERMAATGQALPRIVFLDVKMPRLNGFETLKSMRGDALLRPIPVVMLSGSKEPRDVELARTLGAIDYLVKYAEPEDFLRVLQKAERPA